MHRRVAASFAATLLALALAAAPVAAAPGTPNGPPAPPTAPLHPISYSAFLSDNSQHAFGGGNDGILNVTSFTFTNFSSTVQSVYINQVSTSGPGCTGTVTGSTNILFATPLLPAQQTTQLTFPTALQIVHYNGVSCLGVEVTSNLNGGYLNLLINGFLTYKDGS